MIQDCRGIRFTLILCFILSAGYLSAQDSLIIQYALGGRGTFKEGRLNQTILSLDATYAMTAQSWKAELFGNYKYLKTNGRLGENELLGRVLISILPRKKWFPLIGYIYNSSEFYQIQDRHTPGLGVGWNILKNPSNSLTLYTWGAYDVTQFKNIPDYQTLRINNYITGRFELIKEKLSTRFVLYYLQSLEESSNYIWRIEPTLLFQMSPRFSMSINFESHYENIIDPTNTNRNSALTIGFTYQSL